MAVIGLFRDRSTLLSPPEMVLRVLGRLGKIGTLSKITLTLPVACMEGGSNPFLLKAYCASMRGGGGPSCSKPIVQAWGGGGNPFLLKAYCASMRGGTPSCSRTIVPAREGNPFLLKDYCARMGGGGDPFLLKDYCASTRVRGGGASCSMPIESPWVCVCGGGGV